MIGLAYWQDLPRVNHVAPMIATASTVRIVLEARVGIPVAESNAKIRRNVALISIDVRAAHGNFDMCMRPLKKLGRL